MNIEHDLLLISEICFIEHFFNIRNYLQAARTIMRNYSAEKSAWGYTGQRSSCLLAQNNGSINGFNDSTCNHSMSDAVICSICKLHVIYTNIYFSWELMVFFLCSTILCSSEIFNYKMIKYHFLKSAVSILCIL